MKRIRQKFKGGRFSAHVVVAVVLIMIAVPFTTMHFNTEYSDGAPLVTLSYDANGGDAGSVVPDPQTFEIGSESSQVLFDPLPTRAGYVFTGWGSSPTGPVEYDFATPYEERSFSGSSNTTLYAQWQEIPSTSKFSLNANPTIDREITWAMDPLSGTYKYQYRLAGGTWQVLDNNIIQFSGGTLSTGTIIFSLDGSVPFPDDYRLYVVLDSITATNTSTASVGMKNFMDIRPGAKVIMQLVGDSTVTHGGVVTGYLPAAIRVVGDDSMYTDPNSLYSDLIITGQGTGKLTMKRTAGDYAYASMIGGNGVYSGVAETAGHIQIESGTLDISYQAIRIRGAAIGGGGGFDVAGTRGGDGGIFELHGGILKIDQNSTGAAHYAPAVGGGGHGQKAGDGGIITITGGSLDITQYCNDVTYGLRSSAIGGAASFYSKAGDSGTISISGGYVKVTQTGGAVSGAGIGAAAGQDAASTAGHAIGVSASGVPNYIEISGGHVEVWQSNSSTVNGTLRGAGIGGGAGSDSTVEGGAADVRISGGNVYVNRESTSNIINPQGAGIGGGANESKQSIVTITGGNINIKISVPGSMSAANANLYTGAAIGCNRGADPTSYVQIDGGVITISRMHGATELTNPIGSNGDFGKSPIINGGSIIASADMDLTLGGANTVLDSDGNILMRYVVNLDPADNPQSLFVRKAEVTYSEFNDTKRYVDFHVQGRHNDLNTPGSDYSYYCLYLPAGSAGDINEISLEYEKGGLVKTFSAYGGVVMQTDIGTTFYRVVYRLGERLRYEDDIVHIEDTALFKQSIRAKAAYLGDVVAPWNISYVEVHNEDYNDGAAAKSVIGLDGQYLYFASETPLVLAAGNPQVATSYGNIEFNTTVSGRLVITAEDVKRVDVRYRDDYTYAEDPGIPAPRQIERVFGEGYPIVVGTASDSDPATGPWTQNNAPIAVPPPEPGDMVWTSDYFMFEHWMLNDPVFGTQYDTNDPYYIPAGSGDLVFYSVWEWKGKIYRTENGPGHIEYSLDGGSTWKNNTVTDADGTFFPVPLQTVQLKAVPDPDSVFLQWGDAYGDVTGNISEASVTFTVPGDTKYATAEFRAGGYCITTSVSGNGEISPEGPVFVGVNEDKLFVIIPKSGSMISDVIVDGTSIGPVSSYTFFGIYSDHTIEAVFSTIPPHQYTITPTGSEGVTMNPGAPVSVPAGSNYTVKWTAQQGYAVKGVSIDGISHPELTGAGSYTFTNVLSDHKITVTAEAAEKRDAFYLTVVVDGQGYAEYSLDGGKTFDRYIGRMELKPGSDLVLRAVCADGYEFVRWEGSANGTDETIVINNIAGDVTVTLVTKGEIDALFILIIIGMSSGMTLIAIVVWARGRVDVVMMDSENAMIIGKRIARVNQPYRFFVDFLEKEGSVSYRVGKNKVWKELAQNGGRYEIPKDDVTDTLTIKAF
ncbi:MAG: InlB B-repeat-containing protein [Methanomassiliicoccaceae archaeon]|nr:InlB B-repeat-containing protein [Methanomassiliicoccaceae archaeon]